MGIERPKADREQWPAPFLVRDDEPLPGYPPFTRPNPGPTKRLRQVRRFVLTLVCLIAVVALYSAIGAAWGSEALFGAMGITLGVGFLAVILGFIWDLCDE